MFLIYLFPIYINLNSDRIKSISLSSDTVLQFSARSEGIEKLYKVRYFINVREKIVDLRLAQS